MNLKRGEMKIEGEKGKKGSKGQEQMKMER